MKKIQFPTTYVVWDLETSGLDFLNDRILEVAAAVVEDGEVKSTHEWLLDNKIDIPAGATAIHGITNEMITEKGRDPKECLTEFMKILEVGQVPHLTHNGLRFDIPFLAEQSRRIFEITHDRHYRLVEKLRGTAIDTAVVVKAKKIGMERKWSESFPEFADRVMEVRAYGVKYNVGICCDEMGIPIGTQHRALGDVLLTNEIYKKLLV